MHFDYSKVLVTGGAGFIGSHIVDRLIDEGLNVRVLDNLSTGEEKNFKHHENNKSFEFIKGDIRDFESVKKAVNDVEAVIHEAALVSVTRSVEDPLLSNTINVVGTLNLLKASIDSSVKRFVFASSCAVYGDAEKQPTSEFMLPNPLSPYAADKLAAEHYVKVFNEIYDLETVSLRYFNVYGARQKYGPYCGVISIFVKQLLDGKPLMIYGNGKQTRDFVNVKDVVEANFQALSKSNVAGDTFNIGTGKATTINELAESVQQVMNKTAFKPTHMENRPGDIMHSYSDISKARRILGYKPSVELEEGLRELIRYSENH